MYNASRRRCSTSERERMKTRYLGMNNQERGNAKEVVGSSLRMRFLFQSNGRTMELAENLVGNRLHKKFKIIHEPDLR